MNNPLDRHPQVREALLNVQWGVTGLQTVGSALFLFMYQSPADWPVWFLASLAVAPVLWGYLGFTAQANVTGTDIKGYPIMANPNLEPLVPEYPAVYDGAQENPDDAVGDYVDDPMVAEEDK